MAEASQYFTEFPLQISRFELFGILAREVSVPLSPPDTLSVLARTIGKEVFSPLAAECVQLGLNLTDAVDDPDLRRCT